MTALVRVVGMREKVEATGKTIVVDTTSRNSDPQFDKLLSPFFLGPCELYNGFISDNAENAWQFTKVYKEHVDTSDNPTTAYWTWAQNGWNDSWAHRYPMGKGAKPLYSLWQDKHLGYIEARKTIYAPLYSKAVQASEGFDRLKKLAESSEVLVLRDFDGYDHRKLGMSLSDVLNNPSRKMGHAFVLAALLTNDESMNQWAKTPK